ncbi:MAG: iron-containing alcohol dehydrogenase [Spirochaetes bacterium]|nr:iron-containing alcohol dehydrogenase [Spirochaetota bacterium]
MKEYYEFFCPVKMVVGHKALDHIPYELDSLGAKHPMFITDQGVVSAGLLKHVENAFKNSGMIIGPVFDEVPADSSLTVVNQLASLYQDQSCDSIIAIGGGSVIDTAKGVNIVVSEQATDLMKFTGAGALKKPLKPFIVIPTTAGTGSEVTLVAVIADHEKDQKMLFTSYFLLPNLAVLDSRMTLTLPPHLTAATGMDALTHAVEAYSCLGKNPLSDAYAFQAIGLISQHLIPVTKNPQDKERRLQMAQASTMAGIAFSNSMVGLVHTLGHTIGAICHVPHGMAMSILLPFVLEYNLKNDPSGDYQQNISQLLLPLLGDEVYASTKHEYRADKVITYIKRMKEQLYQLTKMPRTLKETGKVEEAQLEEIAQASLGDASITYNPVEVEFKEALAVLKSAY